MQSQDLMELLVRAMNRMDERLSGHEERVAYRVMKAAQKSGHFSDEEICRLTWTVLLHDIGNYQHTDIADLQKRELQTAKAHARYGYLFLKHFGPYPEDSPLVLYHHSSRQEIEASGMNGFLKQVANCLMLADTVDLYRLGHPSISNSDSVRFIEQLCAKEYHPLFIELLREIESSFPATQEEIHLALLEQLSRMELSEEEEAKFLKVVVSSIDFRSRATALHCTIIVVVADLLARLCGLSEEDCQQMHLAATLHDMGKIAIPVHILESPGKLVGEDWEIMKSHIVLTEEILDGIIDETVELIAVRHHETLDGKGYPRGLPASELTLPQRILSVADVVSALSEERSYKAAFPLEELIRILDGMAQRGKLDREVVDVLIENKELVYKEALCAGRKAKADFRQICLEYSGDCKE